MYSTSGPAAFGGDASINDSAPSLSTTYSGTKVDADNATQDAALTVVDSEVEVNADDDAVYIPAEIAASSGNPSQAVLIIPGETAGARTETNSGGSVIIGQDATPTLAPDAVVIGRGAAAFLTDAEDSVLIGTRVAEGSGSSAVESVIIGLKAGPGNSAACDNCLVLGTNVNTTLQDYGPTGNVTFSAYDIVLGAVASSGTRRPLIRASNDQTSPHWSPGIADADLGTSSRPWSELHLSSSASVSASGASGMYDYCEVYAVADSSFYTDASSQRLSLSSTHSVPSLGHMEISNLGGYTTIRNTSGMTRRWLISTNVWIYAPIGGSTLMVTQNWIMISPTRGAPASTNYYVHSYSNADGTGDAFKGACSEVVEIAADDYVHICGYGDTTDGTSWKVFGNTWKAASSSSVTITELPM